MMRLTIHVRPDQTSFSTVRGTISMRESLRCDEIADALRQGGADVRVVEAQAGDSVESDFWLVFGRDLEWHLSGSELPRERLVVLDPDRDELFNIAEQQRVAALVFYVNYDAWTRDTNGLIVRRDVATRLGGTLGPGAPYVMESEHYAAWRDAARSPLATRLVVYLNALRPQTKTNAPVVVSADEAAQHGLVPVTVRVDANAAGMYVRPFPMADTLVALNGPPGGPLVVMIWDCTGLPQNVEAVIRARMVGPTAKPLEIVGTDRGFLLGKEREGMTFRTGVGFARIVWFAVIVECAGGNVLVGVGIPGHSEPASTASTILSHSSIRAALDTLTIK